MCVCVTDRMIDWIKQGIEKVVPQPEIHVRSKTEVKETTEAPAPTKGTFISAPALVFKQVMLWCWRLNISNLSISCVFKQTAEAPAPEPPPAPKH